MRYSKWIVLVALAGFQLTVAAGERTQSFGVDELHQRLALADARQSAECTQAEAGETRNTPFHVTAQARTPRFKPSTGGHPSGDLAGLKASLASAGYTTHRRLLEARRSPGLQNTAAGKTAGVTGAITGTISDLNTSLPIEHIWVELYDSAMNHLESVQTDASGIWATTPNLDTGDYYVKTWNDIGYFNELYDDIPCEGAGWCDPLTGTPIGVVDGTTTTGIDFELVAGGWIEGSVTEEGTGDPVADVRVVVLSPNGWHMTDGYSDALGQFRTAGGIPTGTYYAKTINWGYHVDEIWEETPCAGWSCDATDGTPINITAGLASTGIDFTLSPGGGRIAGRITEEVTGDPITWDCVATVHAADGSYLSYGCTDHDGNYTIDGGLPPGTYFMTSTSSQGYLDELYDDLPCPAGQCNPTTGTPIAVVADSTTDVSFALEPGGRIEGVITEAATTDPITNARVDIYNDVGDWLTEGWTDDVGAYIGWSGLPAGTYFATSWNDQGFMDELYDDLPCANGQCDPTTGTPIPVTFGVTTSNIDFALPTGGAISGTVTESGTALPIDGAHIEVYSTDGSHWASYSTDAAGTWSTESNLATGSYFVIAWTDLGYFSELYDDLPCEGAGWCDPTAGTPVAVTVGATTTGIDFDLEPGGLITGTVTDAVTGDPVPNVRVAIFDQYGDWVTQGDSDVLGNFGTYGGLPDGTYFAKTTTWDYYLDELWEEIPCVGWSCDTTTGTPIVISGASTASGIDFTLSPGAGLIEGRVTEEGSGDPIAWDCPISVAAADGSHVTHGCTGHDGRYMIEGGIPPGTYYVFTTNSQGYVDELHDGLPCVGGVCDPTVGTPITVVADATTTDIDFALAPGGRIEGVVTEAAIGDPIANTQINIYDDGGNWLTEGWTDGSGGYIGWTGLPTGVYFATTWNDQGFIDELYNDLPCPNGQCDPTTGTPIIVNLGATTPGIDFALSTGGAIAGTVVDSSTALPIEGVHIEVHDAGGDHLGSYTTDAGGAWMTEANLDTGGYHVIAWTNLGYYGELYDGLPCEGAGWCDPTAGTPVAVTVGSTTTGIDFELDPGGHIRGSVTDAVTGDPVPDVRVAILDENGNWVTQGDSDGLGNYGIYGVVPDGTYYAKTTNWGYYLDELWEEIPCTGWSCDVTTGTPIVISGASTASGIDFTLTPGAGLISGQVLEEGTGDPIINDCPIGVVAADGTWLTYGCTDHEGRYAIEGCIPPGTYFVYTDNSYGFLDELFDDLPCPAGQCDPTAGTPITVVADATTTDIDFALAPGGRIEGVITEATTGDPIANARVEIYDDVGNRLTEGWTDGSGGYLCRAGLPAGAYFATTWNDQGYLDELYDDLPCANGQCDPTTGTPIPVTLGATTPGIDFVLATGGAISGTVLDGATAVPIEGVWIEVFATDGNHLDSVPTDAGGNWQTSTTLDTGNYFIKTRNELGYFNEVYNNLPCEGPGWCDPTTGAPIAVTAGSTTGGIFIILEPGGLVTGAVTDADSGDPIPDVRVVLLDPSGNHVTDGYTDALGQYRTGGGVPADTYYAKTVNWGYYFDELWQEIPCVGWSCDPTTGTGIPVTVGSAATGIDFTLSAGAGGMAGRVTDEDTGDPIAYDCLVGIYDDNGDWVTNGCTDDDGRYHADGGLPPGTYYLLSSNSNGYVDELYDDIQCPGGACDPTNGTPITVVANTTTTIDFALGMTVESIFADGFEGGDTNGWTVTFP